MPLGSYASLIGLTLARCGRAREVTLTSPVVSCPPPAPRSFSGENLSAGRSLSGGASRGEQQELPRGAAAGEPLVRLGRLPERHRGLDPQPEPPRGDPPQHIAGAVVELLRGGRVVAERGAGEEERALGVEDLGVERRDRAARVTEQDQEAPRGQAVQALLEGRLADGIVYDVHAAAGGEALRLRFEVGFCVDDDLIRAGL